MVSNIAERSEIQGKQDSFHKLIYFELCSSNVLWTNRILWRVEKNECACQNEVAATFDTQVTIPFKYSAH